MSDLVEVKVSGLALDERTNNPVVILQEKDGKRMLPIWIGKPEASAIACRMAGKQFERPLTHDLLKTIVEGMDGVVTRVLITELAGSTFFAKIVITREDHVFGVDARPSDSIALALRTESPIFVSEALFPNQMNPAGRSEESETDALRRFLRDLPPEDFGKIQP